MCVCVCVCLCREREKATHTREAWHESLFFNCTPTWFTSVSHSYNILVLVYCTISHFSRLIHNTCIYLYMVTMTAHSGLHLGALHHGQSVALASN
jgi:hypothetical protein